MTQSRRAQVGHSVAQTFEQATIKLQERRHSLAQTFEQTTTRLQERRHDLAQTVEQTTTKLQERRHDLAQTVEQTTTKLQERGGHVAERVREVGDETLPPIVTFLVTVRAHLLLFSIPYLWMWTEGLDTIVRLAMVVAHGASLLAGATASSAADWSRGVMPRLALLHGTRWSRPQHAATWAEVITLFAVAAIAALAVSPVPWQVPTAVALLLLGGWVWAYIPLSAKYLGIPEIGVPVLALVLPAATIALTTPASPSWVTVLSGVAFMVATVLATLLGDRGADLAADIPTVATRRPLETRGWLWLTGIVASLAVLTGLYTPLAFAEYLGLIGALAFVAGCALRRLRVPVLVAAHALVGLHWIFG